MSLEGKKITKKQAEILDALFEHVRVCREDCKRQGADFDMTDNYDTFIECSEELFITFGFGRKKIITS